MAENHLPPRKNRILMVINPIMAVLMLSQFLTGINFSRIPWPVYQLVHGGGGTLLFILVCTHLTLNWGWVRRFFLRR